jgi:TolB protein
VRGVSFYVGIGASAHAKDDRQTAVFSKVKVEPLVPEAGAKPVLYSSLETVAIASTDRRCSSPASRLSLE